jgi:hypothetical protein
MAATLSIAAGGSACSALVSFSDLRGGVAAEGSSDAGPTYAPDGAKSTDAANTSDGENATSSDGGCGSQLVPDGLIAYYPLDETNGATATDCSSIKYDALLTGNGYSRVSGHTNGGVSFDGQTGCIEHPSAIPAVLVEDGTKDFSVAMWFRLDGFPAAWPRAFLGGRTTDPTKGGWRLDVEDSNKKATFAFANGAGGTAVTASTVLATGAWHHVAVTFSANPSAIVVYIDGQSRGTGSAGSFAIDPAQLRFACSGDDQNYFQGALDEIRIYSRVLTSADVTLLAQ